MKIVALLAAYNEARFIGPCLDHLARHGIESYLIDNESTDNTVEIARRYLGQGLRAIETFPRLGRFRWQDLLRRKAELAQSLDADWFIHLDPDEFLEPPDSADTLAGALARETAAGYNAVNFAEFVFLPTRESPDHDHPNFQRTMRWYYPFEITDHFRTIAWRKQTVPVDLALHGGHRVEFPDRRISPAQFRMRHYLCLGPAQAQAKFGGRLYDVAEVERGWHGWRSDVPRQIVFPAAADLRDVSLGGLDFREPRRKHLLAGTGHPGPQPRSVWRIDSIAHTRSADLSRVSMNVDGEDLWFESADISLKPSAEGLVAMLLLPALALGARIELSIPVCPRWLQNIEQFLLICRSWWPFPAVQPLQATAYAPTPDRPHGRTACCFTGGVDSFHALRFGEKNADLLFFVHGFDIPLAQTARAESVAQRLRAIAESTGRRFVLLRSNAREHHIFSAVNWIQTHGTALAAAGHLLSDEYTDLVIPSSDVPAPDHAWGSHWRTDPLLGSASLHIVSDAPFVSRVEKLRRLADDPLFQKNVRVCWESPDVGNCGRCEKCLRTMLALDGLGKLDATVAFGKGVSLAESIDALAAIPAHHRDLWVSALKLPVTAEVRAAAERLLNRSVASAKA